MGKKEALEYIDSKAELVTEVSDKIWGYAELSLMEHQSSELYVEVLKKEGFQVETPVCGIETAYIASYGSGKPIIGILAEYDALSGLSQEAGAVERTRPRLRPQHAWRRSHGCGSGCETLPGGEGRRKRNREILRLSRRGGRGLQGVYG